MVFTNGWFHEGIQSLWTQMFAAHGKPLNVLEIGSFEGLSTSWIMNNTEAHITCVDTWEGSDEHSEVEKTNLLERFWENMKSYENRITTLQGKSGVVLRTLTHEPVYDFIYIDGSHYSRDTLEDAVLAYPLLKTGGIMVFDDYMFQIPGTERSDLCNPSTGIDAFINIYKPTVLFVGIQVVVFKNTI